MESRAELVVKQLRQRLAVGGGARSLRQILQDDAGVVGAAEKRAVDSAAHPRVNARPTPEHRRTERRAQRGVGGLADSESQRQTGERSREQQRQSEADET